MKLVDILARELKTWPDNNLGDFSASFVAQDADGELVTLDPKEKPEADQFLGSCWDRSHWTGGDLSFEVAEDNATSIVTRAEWQAAVDALNADKCEHSYANKIGCPECGELNAPKVVEWDGIGDPPVGTVCEYDARPIGRGDPLFVTVEVKYVSDQSIVIICTDVPDGENKENIGVELALMNGISMLGKFRAIRTAEQVAAEERQAIREWLISEHQNGGLIGIAKALHESGYRKQVAK